MVPKPESNRSGGGLQSPPRKGGRNSRRSGTKPTSSASSRTVPPTRKSNGGSNGNGKTTLVVSRPSQARVNLTGLRSSCPSHEICRKCTKTRDMVVRQSCVYDMSQRLAEILDEEHRPTSIFVHTGPSNHDSPLVGGRINIDQETFQTTGASKELVGKIPFLKYSASNQFEPLCVCNCQALLSPPSQDIRRQHEIIASAVLGRDVGFDNIIVFDKFGE